MYREARAGARWPGHLCGQSAGDGRFWLVLGQLWAKLAESGLCLRLICNARTVEELPAAIRRARLLDAGVCFMPVPRDADGRPLEPNGVYRSLVGMFRQMERFAWDQLYNLPSHTKHCTTAPPADAAGSVSALPLEEL